MHHGLFVGPMTLPQHAFGCSALDISFSACQNPFLHSNYLLIFRTVVDGIELGITG